MSLSDSGASPDDELENALPSQRRLRDPVHQYIPISARVCQFVDTEHFQRLKKIKQLGTSYWVWPGASHNRFEHCLGVAHLARRMAATLQSKQPKLGITDRDIECVELAGLCHDLGHGPWSHVWDGMFIPRAMPGTNWKHEDASEMMFDDMIQQHNIVISDKDASFIKALIAGERTKCSPDEKGFLFDIVSNKRNGIDVDKFDYISRDCYHIGDKDNTSFERLIDSARVIDDQICWNQKDALHVYNVCFTRFMLHKQYYSHKTARAIEYMIIDALLKAEPHMKIAERIYNPRQFLRLTDSIMDRIQESEEPELEESRELFRRISTRDLYKVVDWNVLSWDMIDTLETSVTPDLIVQYARAHFSHDALGFKEHEHNIDPVLLASFGPEHVIVDTSSLHHGMKAKNPLDSIGFYSKQHPNTIHKVSSMPFMTILPAHFGEVCLRVYARDSRYFGIIQAGYRELIKTLPGFSSALLTPHDDDDLLTEPQAEPPLPTLTPPATDETPGSPQPRTFSRNPSHASLASELGHSQPINLRSTPAPVNPTTPRMGASASLPGSAGTVIGARGTTPFGINPLTTVSPAYAPPSPTQNQRRTRNAKRLLDENEGPPSKRRAT